MRTLIAIPCMDMVHTMFMKSLISLQKVGQVGFAITSSSLVYDARNGLAKQAISEGFDRILWLDSDMDFAPDLMVSLSNDLDEGRDFVSGLAFTRKIPSVPVVYQKVGYYHDEEENSVTPAAVSYFDYPKDQIFQIEGAGFGACMMSVDLVKRVQDKYGLPFSPILGFGEDLSFCMRARELGAELWCDSRIKVGHIGQAVFNESTYKAYNEAGGK